MATGDANREALPARIGDRYRVEKLLGTGGMASVFQVLDEVTGRRLALKRLKDPEQTEPDCASKVGAARRARYGGDSHAAQLFEREFDTLSQLVHPHIIEVYDYDRDAHGPYYTMELLDGGDLRELSPLPWRDACRVLCDVCSAISLLHSRRLVHRDLTPLNIRRTPAGSAKLFDFGSMMPFGRSRHVVGTPPFVAPEALHGETVDAQTDLFALGATAYYTLTGQHAYPARQLLALPEAWLHPPSPPSQHVPEIPAALDELVLWLLQMPPSARPPSAAEVMERLSAIGGFELREELVVRQAYLSTPLLVGRDHALGRMRERLREAVRGRGGTLVVTAPPGGGRTRVLDACALEARLLGAIVLRADEREGSTPWGVAGALVRQLLAQAPELAVPAARRWSDCLGPLVPEVAEGRALLPEPGAGGEHAFRARATAALRDLMLQVAEGRPLVIAVDDVHRIDQPSLAFLALVAHEASSRRVLLIASTERLERNGPAPALHWLVQSGEPLRLRLLDPHQTQELVRSLFGEPPNMRLLADRIHAASHGNPSAIMQIARQLVATGRARYAAGTWTLPTSIETAELALVLHDRFEPHVRGSALELARGVAACDGQRLSFRECLLLAPHGDARKLIGELDELVAAGVLALHAGRYFVNGTGTSAALLRDLDPGHARALHARVAELQQARGDQPFRLALHQFRAGDAARALDTVLSELRKRRAAGTLDLPATMFAHVQTLPKGWRELFRGLVVACAALGRPCRDRLEVQLSLLAYSSFTGGYERQCLHEILAQLSHDCGLDLYAALDRAQPAQARLVEALTACQARFATLPEHVRGLPLDEAIPMLVQVLSQALAMAGRALDHDLLVSLPSLEPLLPLSPALSVVQDTIDGAREVLSGRVLAGLARVQSTLARLAEPGGVAGMNRTHHELMSLALQWTSGTIEANWGNPDALARAESIAVSPFFAVNAWRVRALFALFQGDLQAAERCRVQTELLQIQNSAPQLFEGTHAWQMALGYFAARDLSRTKQCISELEGMARQFEPWKPTVHFARGAYQTLRGDGVAALAEFERARGSIELGSHIAWAACSGGVLEALNLQRRYGEAARRGHAMLEEMRRAGHPDLEFFVALPLAEAQIECGRSKAASELIAGVLDAHEGPGRRSVYLARAYELRAWVALRAGDAPDFQRALALCQQQYASATNPVLRGKLDQLRRAARAAGLLREPLAIERRRSPPDATESGSMVATVLSSCEQTQERVERALLLLTRHSRCTGGFLYTLRTDGPALVATRGGRDPLPQLHRLVQRFVLEHAGPRELTRSQSLTTAGRAPGPSWRAPDGTRFVPMLLAHRGELGACITGVAVMWLSPEASYRVPSRLLSAVSRTLHESGDTITLVDRPQWSIQ